MFSLLGYCAFNLIMREKVSRRGGFAYFLFGCARFLSVRVLFFVRLCSLPARLCPFFHLLVPVFFFAMSICPRDSLYFPVLLPLFAIVSRETSCSQHCLFAFYAIFCGFGVVFRVFHMKHQSFPAYGAWGRGRATVPTICMKYLIFGWAL